MDDLLSEFLTETNESLGAARSRARQARTEPERSGPARQHLPPRPHHQGHLRLPGIAAARGGGARLRERARQVPRRRAEGDAGCGEPDPGVARPDQVAARPARGQRGRARGRGQRADRAAECACRRRHGCRRGARCGEAGGAGAGSPSEAAPAAPVLATPIVDPDARAGAVAPPVEAAPVAAAASGGEGQGAEAGEGSRRTPRSRAAKSPRPRNRRSRRRPSASTSICSKT